MIWTYHLSDPEHWKDFWNCTRNCHGNPLEYWNRKPVSFGDHSWTMKMWLDNSRVYIQRCRKCGDVRFYRGNNTVHISRELKIIRVLVHSIETSEGYFFQYPEFEEPKWIHGVLKEAGFKIKDIRKKLY